jgi:hypothetical protein
VLDANAAVEHKALSQIRRFREVDSGQLKGEQLQ